MRVRTKKRLKLIRIWGPYKNTENEHSGLAGCGYGAGPAAGANDGARSRGASRFADAAAEAARYDLETLNGSGGDVVAIG